MMNIPFPDVIYMENNKKLASWLVPVIIGVVVIVALAVGGSITRNADEKKPTASTSQSETVKEGESATVSQTEGKSKVSIVAVGDNLIHNTLIAAGEQSDGSLNYDSFYKDIKKYIEPADIAIINQETILGGDSFEYSGYPAFNSPWEIGDAAIKAGFDVFTCATNHSMDMGTAGVEKELEYFNSHKEVVHIGTNASETAYNQITYYKKNNITFALLNYTSSLNGISLPSDKEWLVNMMDKEKITKDVTEARKNADVVMVFPHWGTENSHEISAYQEEYTKLFSDLGVDIVIGCHPHVLQPVKWVENEETGKKMLVYYSLGNFISHQLNLNQLCGGMAEITVEKNNGKIKISSAKLAPVVCHYMVAGDKMAFTVYKLSDYTDALAKTQVQKGATVDYFTDLSEKVIDKEFLDI